MPVLVKGIEASLTSDKSIKISVKKCVDDAFPGDYGGRSKWDINRCLPWKELATNGRLRDHLEAQFDCTDFSLAKCCIRTSKSSSALDEVRDIIRAIFYGHYNNSFQFMAVHGVENPDDRIFFIRIHPPVRFSPHGCPLLLVSVIDYPRLEELIEQGKVDREAFQSEFHRLVTEGVSKEVCIIRASSNEELSLFRYVLRVNSTKMRRSVWQSRNLPRGDDHPWIMAFISPLYKEILQKNCQELDEALPKICIPSDFDLFSELQYRQSCAFCFVTKVTLKSCGRCHRLFYCSTSCQGNHWLAHKVAVIPLRQLIINSDV